MTRPRLIKYTAFAIVAVVALFLAVDEIHVGAPPVMETGAIDPAAYAQRFWQEMPRAVERAVDVAVLLELLETDLDRAVEKYGRTLGVASVHSFLVKGKGRAVEVRDKGVLVDILYPKGEGEVLIRTAGIFGDFVVRDASGLVDVSEFPSTMVFNEVGSAINKKIVTEIIPSFREEVSEGAVLSFVGATVISEEDLEYHPLRLVPVSVEVE